MKWPTIAKADLAERSRAVLWAAGLVDMGQVADLRRKGQLKDIAGATLAVRNDLIGALDDLEAAITCGRKASPRPIGGGGLMGLNRARTPIEGDTDLEALHRSLDFFPTEPWAGRAVADLIRTIDPQARSVHEPAAGEGHLVHALTEYFPDVRASDIFGHGGRVAHVRDYLGPPEPMDDVDWVVTNPPFDGASDFVRTALSRARRGVAILQRLTWLETVGRDALFFGDEPLTLKASFAERVQMRLGVWDPDGSGQTPCAWYLWLRPDVDNPSRDRRVRAAWSLQSYVGLRFPPGSRRRFTRPDDVRLFGPSTSFPSLDPTP
jgi:hypothetical protein